MRAILILLLVLSAFTIAAAPHAAATAKCEGAAGQSVCVYPNEPEYVECVSIDGKAAVCVFDPCGTTRCF